MTDNDFDPPGRNSAQDQKEAQEAAFDVKLDAALRETAKDIYSGPNTDELPSSSVDRRHDQGDHGEDRGEGAAVSENPLGLSMTHRKKTLISTCAESGLRFAVVALFPVTDFARYRGKRATDGEALAKWPGPFWLNSWLPR